MTGRVFDPDANGAPAGRTPAEAPQQAVPHEKEKEGEQAVAPNLVHIDDQPPLSPSTPDDMSDRYRAACGEMRTYGTVQDAMRRLRGPWRLHSTGDEWLTRRESPERVAAFLRSFAERWWGVRS